ncbi:MAG: ABC transporter permease [Alphaproteobacteria bacterium]|nr:ABC transporter permease [Alphaproteobacteria bacterium]
MSGALAPSEGIAGPRPGARVLAASARHPGLVAGLAVLLLLTVAALAAPLLAPHDPYAQDLANRIVPPAWMDGAKTAHPLGTDHLGRDYLSRLLYGARVSLGIGLAVALLSGLIGTALGVTAGYFGGRIDMIISFVVTTRLALPIVLVALAAVALVGASLQTLVAVMALLLWDRYAVVMRAATQQMRSRAFVTAARAVGCSTPRIIVAEILPNLANQLIVVATLEMAQAILLEAALSFLGLGVQAPIPSWGLMIAEGKEHILFEPWLIFMPGALLVLLVLAINTLGDGLRDVAAPSTRA